MDNKNGQEKDFINGRNILILVVICIILGLLTNRTVDTSGLKSRDYFDYNDMEQVDKIWRMKPDR